jgi:oligoribonuclease NrnB/cAMP/cGMP phosphodiesterase (DHH superfamily)
MKNYIVIYHSADYDGILSGLATKFWLNRSSVGDPQTFVQMVGWDYGKPVPEKDDDGILLDYGSATEIYIVDLSVDELMSRPELRDKIVWIDHHKSAIEKWDEKFDAADPLDRPFRGLRIDGVAACRLCWQFGLTNFFALDKMARKQHYVDRLVEEPLLIRLAGEYDIWDKRDPRADILQLGLRALNKDQFDRLVWMSFTNPLNDKALDHPLSLGNTIQSYVDQSNKSMMKNSHVIKWCDLIFLVCNGAKGSLSFKSHVTKDHDALMAWTFNGKEATVSLYGVEHRPDVDLSVIATAMGGGGHKQACGFRLPLEDLSNILSRSL